MKVLPASVVMFFLFLLAIPQVGFGQAPGVKNNDMSPSKKGCRMVDVHCKCTNPDRDFVVENQKLGRANLGEPGECRTSKEIDASAAQMPVAYCLKGESVKDTRLGASKCTATWTCKEACEIEPGLK